VPGVTTVPEGSPVLIGKMWVAQDDVIELVCLLLPPLRLLKILLISTFGVVVVVVVVLSD